MTDYSGHVEQDGDWQDRTDGPVRVRKLSVGEMDNDVYVVSCTATGKALIVDAAARADLIRAALHDVDPIAVVQTHGHWDHVRAWDDLHADPGLPIWGHTGDRELFPRAADRWLGHDEVLEVGDLSVRVIHTPGHTEGALQFVVDGATRSHLFSGDSLFPGGPGNTWGDATKFAQLIANLEDHIFAPLPDETWVYPGHGDDTTLGAERPMLPEWRARGW